MTSFYTKLSNIILENDEFKKASNMLFNAYIKKTVNEHFEIKEDIVKKLSTSLQYFYQSDNDSAKKTGAELLSMLLYISSNDTPELLAIAGHVFNESGDFPNIELLQRKFPNNSFKISIFDEARKEFKKSLNTVGEINHPLTDYQRNLWEHLMSGEDVITAAPTSTGKTHIILKYLVNEVASSSGAFAAIIVPTRALISEVANKVYDITKEMSCENDIEICTFSRDGAFKDKTIFIMTQERLAETLQVNLLTFDYLFVDEAHNISDKSRGVLLHMTLQKLLEDSAPQIIISMPSNKYINAFDSVFGGIEFVKKSTNHSPVAKIIVNTSLKGKDIILSKEGSGETVAIKKNFIGTNKTANIAYRLGKGESNIIYRNRPDYCEKIIDAIAKLIPEEKEHPHLLEAADYISKFIHQDFTLAANLKKGVAFHYGPLPGVVRRMVESLAREGLIDFIACTSTLAEGVNFPAKNLFLQNPMYRPRYRPAERLEDVVVSNITGRAGRMLEHFAGNIFLIEPEGWKFKDYFNSNDDKSDKIPTYYRIINDDPKGVIDTLRGTLDDSRDNTYTYYAIANKLLREYESQTISETLSAKELILSQKIKNTIISEVKNAHEGLKVSPFTLEANPTVGYLQQNNLYNFLRKQDKLAEWAPPHPLNKSLYEQLTKICFELDNFGIYLPKYASIETTCAIAKKWIQGQTLRTIIAEQRTRNPDEPCNTTVRNTISIINNDIRFKMASALRCYQLLLSDVAQQRRTDIATVKLHRFIEIGGCSDQLIQLANFGLSRETAVEIHRLLGRNVEITSLATLRTLYKSGMLDAMHVITKREVEKILL